eukprot:1175652-Prorocentrum_minimum.AAC.2
MEGAQGASGDVSRNTPSVSVRGICPSVYLDRFPFEEYALASTWIGSLICPSGSLDWFRRGSTRARGVRDCYHSARADKSSGRLAKRVGKKGWQGLCAPVRDDPFLRRFRCVLTTSVCDESPESEKAKAAER